MTYGLHAAFGRAVDNENVRVIVLGGNGEHFSAGHDIGTPERDHHVHYDNRAVWWDHVGKSAGDQRFAREAEVYLGMCRRWREIPKPIVAMIQGACIAGGLMLDERYCMTIAFGDITKLTGLGSVQLSFK